MALIKKLRKFQSVVSKKQFYIPAIAILLLVIGTIIYISVYATKPKTAIQNFASGNYTEAIQQGLERLKTNPDDVKSIQVTAAAFLRRSATDIPLTAMKDTKEAVVILAATLKKHPNDAETMRLLASAYLNMGNLKQAQSYGIQANILSQNKDPYVLSTLGNIYEALGNIPAASYFYNKAVAISPKNENALVGKANTLLALKKNNDAITIGHQLTLSADVQMQAFGHQILGTAYSQQNINLKDSENEFAAALKINPGLLSSQLGYADILLREFVHTPTKNAQSALAIPMNIARKVLANASQKNNPFALSILARAYRLLNDTKNATTYGDLAYKASLADTSLSVSNKTSFKQLFGPIADRPKVTITSIDVVSNTLKFGSATSSAAKTTATAASSNTSTKK